jgi:hypothetical protein
MDPIEHQSEEQRNTEHRTEELRKIEFEDAEFPPKPQGGTEDAEA